MVSGYAVVRVSTKIRLVKHAVLRPSTGSRGVKANGVAAPCLDALADVPHAGVPDARVRLQSASRRKRDHLQFTKLALRSPAALDRRIAQPIAGSVGDETARGNSDSSSPAERSFQRLLARRRQLLRQHR